jgi:threonine/homoserine/homoserine lactone efflux protein
VKAVLLLLGPLVLVIGVALAMFGTAGPADDDIRAQTIVRLIGMAYGAYLVVLSFAWTRRAERKDPQERR